MSFPFLGSYINKKFTHELNKSEKETIVAMQKDWDSKRCNSMPEDGMSV